jgi:hypothetical protein
MIIERSSYAGLGKFGSQWLGDNYSKVEYMGYSVTGTMAHNIAGIPLVGADICGFIGNVNAELCARWYTMGAFYPFSRNHNAIGNDPQLPWNFDQVYMNTIKYSDIIKRAMYNKLHMIRYYYTQMSLVQDEGGAFYRPLFFDFPNDDMAYENQQLNVMLGPSLKLGIQSTSLATSTEFYYPAGRYCSVFCKMETDCCVSYATGQQVTKRTLAFDFYLDLMAGHLIPMQNATALFSDDLDVKKNITTEYLQDHPVELHLMPLCNAVSDPSMPDCTATGQYINDDGVTIDMTERHRFHFTYNHNKSATVGAAPESMDIDITSTGPNKTLNANDKLGGIQIYDYTNMNFTGATYKVSVTQNGVVKNVGSTTFRQVDDRLSWVPNIGVSIDELRELTKISFAKQA